MKAIIRTGNMYKRQLAFMSLLTFDVVADIFSYLSRMDCLTCMAVCRDWYKNIPQYTEYAGREIELRMLDASIKHRRRERCLGQHVKRVVLRNVTDGDSKESLNILMQRLTQWNCTEIESLGKCICMFFKATLGTNNHQNSYLVPLFIPKLFLLCYGSLQHI